VTTKTLGNQTSGAIFSPCQRYRYVLWRDLYADWLDGSLPEHVRGDCVWIGLNPSTADHTKLDNTCRRCLSWTRAWNCRRYIMLNCYAFRATDPKVMFQQDEPVGELNDHYLRKYTAKARYIIAAWGTNVDEDTANLVCEVVGRTLHCLGANRDGSPKHPLYVKGSAERAIYWRKP
jgi:hypothetical protein